MTAIGHILGNGWFWVGVLGTYNFLRWSERTAPKR